MSRRANTSAVTGRARNEVLFNLNNPRRHRGLNRTASIIRKSIILSRKDATPPPEEVLDCHRSGNGSERLHRHGIDERAG